jgi:hypothetical protein
MIPALLMFVVAGASGDAMPVIDPADTAEPARWVAIHDTVMGGRSSGGLTAGDGCLVFNGHLSLENNGGFASVRTLPRDFGMAAATGLRLRVRGDGRTYQVRLRPDDAFDGVAWRFEFTTKPGQWLDIEAPLAVFEPVWRGRRVDRAGAIDPARVRQLGLMIADKQAGDFRLEVAGIEAF